MGQWLNCKYISLKSSISKLVNTTIDRNRCISCSESYFLLSQRFLVTWTQKSRTAYPLILPINYSWAGHFFKEFNCLNKDCHLWFMEGLPTRRFAYKAICLQVGSPTRWFTFHQAEECIFTEYARIQHYSWIRYGLGCSPPKLPLILCGRTAV